MAFDPSSATALADASSDFDPSSASPAPAAGFDPNTAAPADAYVDWVKHLEGFKPKAYGDYKQTSIGYGTRAKPGETTISKEEADARLRDELAHHEQRIDQAAKEFGYQLTPGQRDALISFDYNTGSGRSVMQVSEGDPNRIADHLGRYTYAGGKENKGLIARRAAELVRFHADDPGAFDPNSATPDDNGKGRLQSAGETFLQTAEAGLGKAAEGFGNFSEALLNADRGGDSTEALRELDGLNRMYGKSLKLPDTPANVQTRQDLLDRANYLRTTLGYDTRLKLESQAGTNVQQDAETRFQPNPAYEGEFMASTVPQVGGSAVAGVAPFLVPGGAAAGVTAMFGQTYQDGVDQSLAKGADAETAIKHGLQYAVVATGLQAIGEGITAGAMKTLAAKTAGNKTLAALLKSKGAPIIQATTAGGLSGAGQEVARQEIVDGHLNPIEIAKQGALSALGGLMVSAPAAGVGTVTDRLTRTRTKAAPIETAPNAEGVFEPATATPVAEETAAPAPAAEPVPPEMTPGADAGTGPAEGAPVPAPSLFEETPTRPAPPATPEPTATGYQPDEYALRNRRKQDAAGLGWPAKMILKMSDAELKATVDGKQRYVPADDPGETRTERLLDAVKAQREQQAERQAAESGQAPAAEPEIDIPFAKQPGSPEANEEHRLQGLVRETWRQVGERNGPKVVTVKSAAEIPDNLGGNYVRSIVDGDKAIAEAYFYHSKRLGRQIVIVKEGAQRVANERGISLDQRVRQLALHELVHHYGSLGAIFDGANQRQYNAIVDGLLARLGKTQPDVLAWLTKPAAEGGYGYDLNNAKDRAAAAEEYLARQHESTTKPAGWVTRTVAQIKELLRKAFPKLAWTDGDVRALLDSARRRASQASQFSTAEPPRVAYSLEANREIPEWLKRIDREGQTAEDERRYEDTSRNLGRSLESAHRLASGSGSRGEGDGSRVTAESLLDHGALPELDHEALRKGLAAEPNLGRNEHVVVHPEGSPRAYKITKPGEFGARGDVVEYLQRLADSNRLFDDDIQLIGAARDPESGQLRLVTSQPWIAHARPATPAEIEAYMKEKGFLRYSDRAFYNPTTEMLVSDAEGVNVVVDRNGVVHPIDVIPQKVSERKAEMYENIVRRRAADAAGDMRFSAQPADSETPEKRRQFIERVKAAPQTQPIAAQVESLYRPLSDKAAIEAAKQRINTLGLDAAEREILAIDPKTNPPTKASNVLAIELMGRLAASGEFAREAAIAVKIAEGNTSQAQAIQAMAIFQRMSSGGIQSYAANLVETAVRTGKFDAGTKELYARIQKLQAELEKLRAQSATGAVLDVQKTLEAAGFTKDKLADIQQKLRQALVIATVQPGNAKDKIVGLLIAAGMERKTAAKLAERAVNEVKRRSQVARDRILRGMLAIKRGMPETAALDNAIQSQLRGVMQAHGDAVWARYRQSAAEALGNTAARMADPGERVRTPALQDFTARLLNTLKSQLPIERQPQTERDGIALLAEAVNNRDKYEAVWNEARRFVADKYRGNPAMLDRMDQLIGHQLAQPFSQTTLQHAIDDGLSRLETSVKDLLTKSHLDKAVAKAQLVSLISDQVGVSGAEAESLGNSILQRWNVAEAKAREAYAQGLFKDPIAKVSKGELTKWIEMNNAGLLDDSSFFAQISNKYGLPTFGPREASMIADLQKKFEQAPDGDQKLVAGGRMMDAIHSLIPSSLWSKVSAVRTMAMLFNPKTIIRNVIGNQVMLATDVAADTLNGWVVDPMVSLVTGERARTSANVAARLGGLMQPVRDFQTGMEQGRQEGHTGKLQLFSDGLAYVRDMGRLTSAGIWDTGSFTKTFKHTFTGRTGRLFEDGLAVALGSFDRAFHASAFQASLADQMASAKRNGREVLAPTPEMLDQALLDANRAIFQDENIASRVLKESKRALNYLSPQTMAQGMSGEKMTPGDFGLGSVLVPFAQIPGSILTRGVEFSPAGFIRSSYELLAPHLGRTKPFDQRAFANSLSRAIVGSAGWALGAYLLKLGVLSALPDDDKDLEAMRKSQGLGGLKVNTSELFRRMLSGNWSTPATMTEAAQNGDLVINYDWLQPAAFMLAAGAQYQQEQGKFATKEERGKLASTGGAFMAGLLGAAQSQERMSVVRNLQQFASDVSASKGFSQAIANQIATMGGSFVPTVMSDLATVVDPLQRETQAAFGRHPLDAAINAVTSRTPGLTRNFPPRYDVLGDAMQRYQYPGVKLFQAFVSPAFLSEVKKDPRMQELERIYNTTGASEATPSARTRTVTINSRQRELTNEELANYKYFTGRVAATQLGAVLASPAWARLPASVQVKYVSGIFSDAAAAGKVLLFGDRPKNVEPGLIRAAVTARRVDAQHPPNP